MYYLFLIVFFFALNNSVFLGSISFTESQLIGALGPLLKWSGVALKCDKSLAFAHPTCVSKSLNKFVCTEKSLKKDQNILRRKSSVSIYVFS